MNGVGNTMENVTVKQIVESVIANVVVHRIQNKRFVRVVTRTTTKTIMTYPNTKVQKGNKNDLH